MRSAARAALVAGGAGVAAHLLPGVVAWRSMRCLLAPVLAGVGAADHVALTFDDGPDPAATPAVLDALDGLGWRATFFVLGSQVHRAPEVLDEIVARGHEIGVHGYRHVSHLRVPYPLTAHDLIRARDLVEDRTGTPLRWFRPPYGALSASSLAAARRAGLQTVLWTTWGRDWRAEATPQSVACDVARTWHTGATVLLHDSDVTSAPGAWRSALGALPLLAEAWGGLAVGPLLDHGLPVRTAPGRQAGHPCVSTRS